MLPRQLPIVVGAEASGEIAAVGGHSEDEAAKEITEMLMSRAAA